MGVRNKSLKINIKVVDACPDVCRMRALLRRDRAKTAGRFREEWSLSDSNSLKRLKKRLYILFRFFL